MNRRCINILSLLACVACAHALEYTWDGGGDPNRGGDWNNSANWDVGGTVPDDLTDSANLPLPGIARFVTNSVDTTVATLTMTANGNNNLWLDANLTVSNFVGGSQPMLHMNGYTFTVYGSAASYLPRLTGGGGLFVKSGPTTSYAPGASTGYTGDYIISNGVFIVWGGNMGAGGSTNMTICDGASVQLQNPSPEPVAFPSNVVINGDGGGNGVLRSAYKSFEFSSDVIVASDAKIVSVGSLVLSLLGDLRGPGALTIEGPGSVRLVHTNVTYANRLIVSNGTLTVSGYLPEVTNIWVDNGGVLEGLPVQFPSATVVTTNGGVWDQQLSATWTGDGDGTNWSDISNWWPNIIPTNVVTIGTPSGVRTIVVDVASSASTLVLDPVANNRLRLEADMAIRYLNSGSASKFDLNGFTLAVATSEGTYMATIDGQGRFVKTGTGTVTWSASGGPSLDALVTISNGVLFFRSGDWSGITNMMIESGGTLHVQQNQGLPQAMVISGRGYDGDGALLFFLSQAESTMSGPITVASDATIRNKSGSAVATLAGDINGPGTLTLEGSGTIDITHSNITYGGMLIITNGAVNFIGTAHSITNITIRNAGTLWGSVNRFPGVIVGTTTNVFVEAGGTWIQDAVGQWDGNGDPDNSGNWSDAANWTGNEVPVGKAILPDPTVNRYITNDVPRFLPILHMLGANDNHLVVNAPLYIRRYESVSAGGTARCENNSLITVSNASTWLFNMYGGTGTFVKVGAETITANNSEGFTGDWIVSNGTLIVRSAQSGQWRGAKVIDGATIKLESPGSPGNYFGPPNLTLSGSGDQNGALWNSANNIVYSNLTIAADAFAYVLGAFVMSFNGVLEGPGILVKQGAGTMDLNGIWSFDVGGALANSVIVSNGTFDISDCALDLIRRDASQVREFVVVRRAGGTLTGQFAATNNLRNGWQLVYDGTIDNPDCVVIVAPASGTLLQFR